MTTGASTAAAPPAICKVCAVTTRAAFQHQVLKKYEARYSQCPACGFLQAEEPRWLDEAYSNAIASADTGIMQRNLYLSKLASTLLWYLFGGKGKFLDAAGGYGLLTRLMRDAGFDYYWCDPHAQNLVARGFEGSVADGPYQAVTAFEVLEHLVDPIGFLSNLVGSMGARTLLVSTELFAGEAPAPDDWWYYAFETGQHISFYRRSTLEVISRRLGLRLYSNRNVHLWTDKRLSPFEFWVITQPRFATALSSVPRLRLGSKVQSDHIRLLKS
jgi:hypothetical protein